MNNQTKYKKANIPKALREQIWIKKAGKVYEIKCSIVWCENKINVFNFQCGHIIPESKGGKTDISNLIPICDRCNYSMNNKYTIIEWNKLSAPSQNTPVKNNNDLLDIYPKNIIKVHQWDKKKNKPWWICF